MSVSIFIKTYYKDFKWLQYLLPSIERYANNFESIIIVSDDDGNIIPDEYIKSIKNIPIYIHYVKLPIIYPNNIHHGLGYLWQQYIKLNWFKYCNSDTVLILDSDEILTTYITPDNFKYNDKWIWTYRLWKDAEYAIIWKDITDTILQIDTKYEAMCISGFILTKSMTIQLLEYLYNIHNDNDLWNIINKYNIVTMSEFNIYGSYINHINNDQYYCNIYCSDLNLINKTINKYRSWDGISDEIHNKNMSYL